MKIQWTKEWPTETGDYFGFDTENRHNQKFSLVSVENHGHNISRHGWGRWLFGREEGFLFSTEPIEFEEPT